MAVSERPHVGLGTRKFLSWELSVSQRQYCKVEMLGQVARRVSLSLQVVKRRYKRCVTGRLSGDNKSREAGGVQWLRGADWQDGMRKGSLPYSGPTSEDLS